MYVEIINNHNISFKNKYTEILNTQYGIYFNWALEELQIYTYT